MEKLPWEPADSDCCNGGVSDCGQYIAILLCLEGPRDCFDVAYTLLELSILSSWRLVCNSQYHVILPLHCFFYFFLTCLFSWQCCVHSFNFID